MPISGGYRHKDYPVGIGTAFIRRLQSINLQKSVGATLQYEMGNQEPAGAAANPATYTGDLNWFPVDLQVESLMLGLTDITNASPKGLLEFIEADGVTIVTPKDTFTGCKVTSLHYEATVGGDFTGRMGVEGLSRTAGSAITIINPTGVGSYRGSDVVVSVCGTQAARAQRVTIDAVLRTDRLHELSAVNPVSIDYGSPQVTMSIDWVESDSATGQGEFPLTSPASEIAVFPAGNVSGAKRITGINMFLTGIGPRGMVNGYATRRYDYMSKGDSSYGGLRFGSIV